MDKEEFEMKQKLLKLEHKQNMEQLKYARDTVKLKHENELGAIRFRSAAIQRGKYG